MNTNEEDRDLNRLEPAKTTDGRFLVVGRTVNDKQEHFYEVVSVEHANDHKAPRFFVTVGKNTPNASGMGRQMEEIYSGKGERRPLRMTTALTTNPSLQMLVSCEPELTRNERVIFDEKGEKLGEFTEEVARASEGSLDSDIEGAAIRFLAEIEAERHNGSPVEDPNQPGLRGSLKSVAKLLMLEGSELHGLNLTEAEIDKLFGPDPINLDDIVIGQQDGPGKQTNRVRYSLNHHFETQVPQGCLSGDRRLAISALKNFSLQRATASAFASRCESFRTVDNQSVSLAALHEKNLIEGGHLAGHHPRKTDVDHKDISSTRGFQIGANVLQGLMASMGAEPADPTKDETEFRVAHDAESNTKHFLHTAVEAQVAALVHDTPASRLRSYISIAHDHALKNLTSAKRLVKAEQDKTRPRKMEKKPNTTKGAGTVLVEGLFNRVLPDLFKGVLDAADHSPRMFC